MKVLTAEEVRRIDTTAVESLGIPSAVLVENAAVAAAQLVRERFPNVSRVAICCGRGNNGGDGLALARQLCDHGFDVAAFLFCSAEKLRGDAALQDAICRAIGIEPVVVEEGGLASALAVIGGYELIIDALLGTGLSRPVEGWLAKVIDGLNALSAPILAIDLPSGLDSNQAEVPGAHIEANTTLTFFGPKVAHVLPPATDAVGELWLARLTVPQAVIEAGDDGLRLLEVADLKPPRRSAQAHKGTYGHVLLVAGSRGKSGAAVLAAKAALRCGAGLVTAAVPENILSEVEKGCTEAMGLPLSMAEGRLGEVALEEIRASWQRKEALAIGPGLGDEEDTAAWIRRAVAEAPLSVVLDADGINAFAGRAEELQGRQAESLLTPHADEIGRLLGEETPRSGDARLRVVREAARRAGAVVVLKGHRSLIATPTGQVFVNPTGNSGMATAGSGDVLTGMCAAWIAQGCGALEAAQLSTFVHGLAGDLAAQYWGERSLMATDLLPFVPRALRLIESAKRAKPPLGPCVPIGRTDVGGMIARAS